MLFKRKKLIMLQNLSLINGDIRAGFAIKEGLLQIKGYSQKLIPYLFQDDVVLYFESYWKQENAAGINCWCFIKVNDWTFQSKKNGVLRLNMQNVMALKKKKRLWLTMVCGWHILSIFKHKQKGIVPQC